MNGVRDSLVFRSWNRNNKEDAAIQEVLARVNLERGHFRTITETSLQEELAAEGGLDASESDSEEEEDGGKAQLDTRPGKVATREELFKSKNEMLSFIAQAEQDVLKSLDFVSLLESKHNPNGGITVSQVLKQNVPLGSLGTDIWHRMPEDTARQAQEDLMATTVRMEGLHQSADLLLSAATRLQENARNEAKYWEEILAVSEKGWSVSSIRKPSHLLGVHFGFSGSAPEFARRDLAALVTDTNGNITLERGVGTKPMAMRAVVRQQGRIVGSSRLPDLTHLHDATLDARIRYARDSLYDEELNHELIRESRDLAAHGVSLKGSVISFDSNLIQSDISQTLSLELVALDQNNSLGNDASDELDLIAEAAVLVARLLLGQAHRAKLKQKSNVPGPLSEKKEDRHAFSILRPLVWLVRHYSTVKALNHTLDNVTGILRKASIECSFSRLEISFPTLSKVEDVGSLLGALLLPLSSTASLDIARPSSDSPSTIQLRVLTSLQYPVGSIYTLTGPGSTRSIDFIDLGDLMSTFDGLVSEVLAAHLTDSLGQDWRCDAREAKVAHISESRQSQLRVSVNSASNHLSLWNRDRKVEWTDQEEDAYPKFLESGLEMATPS